MPASKQVTPIERFHAAVVASHDAIKQAGHVPVIYEDNFYDPVDYQHAPDSWHYYKQKSSAGLWLACAADINVRGDVATENRILNTVVVPIMKRFGVAFICPANTSINIAGHSGANQHLHADVGQLGNTTNRWVYQSWAGKPTIGETAPKPGLLTLDGRFGPATKSALQRALGQPVTGSLNAADVKKLQTLLRGKASGWKNLAVDGRFGPDTITALQTYLGTPRDGVLSSPVSTAVLALQRRLNAGTF